MEQPIRLIWGSLTLIFAITALTLFTLLPRPREEPRLVSNSNYSGVIATKNQSRAVLRQYGVHQSYTRLYIDIGDAWFPTLTDINHVEAELSQLFELLPIENWSYIRQPGDHGQGSIPRPLKLFDLSERRWRRGLNPLRKFYRLYLGIFIRNEPAIAVTFFDERTQFEAFVEGMKARSAEFAATGSFRRIDLWPFHLPNATVFLVKTEDSLRVDGVYLWHWAGGLDLHNGIGKREIGQLLYPRLGLHCGDGGWVRKPIWRNPELQRSFKNPITGFYMGKPGVTIDINISGVRNLHQQPRQYRQ